MTEIIVCTDFDKLSVCADSDDTTELLDAGLNCYRMPGTNISLWCKEELKLYNINDFHQAKKANGTAVELLEEIERIIKKLKISPPFVPNKC